METLKKIIISESTKNRYQSIIELIAINDSVYYVIVTTFYKTIPNRFEERYDNYKDALDNYFNNVIEYAEHTAYMNL